jgi:hypothetical protein
MAQFIKIGDSIVNLRYVRAVEHADDGRLNVYLSGERNVGLVLRYSGEEARQAWKLLCDPAKVPLINDAGALPGSDGTPS